MLNISQKIKPQAGPVVAAFVFALALTGCSHDRLKTAPVAESHETSQEKMVVLTAQPAVVAPKTAEEVAPVASTYNSHDLWQRVRDGYQLDAIEHPRIDDAVTWFNAKKSVIRKSSQRADPLLYHIVEAVTARDLPAELSLVPLLETGYRIHARSPYGALGPWQFMPATGRQYGLSRTAYTDQRRNLVLSTEAGLSYLTDLYRQFDQDWLLAIAAYNAGPGTVKKALGGERKTFWEIVDKLPTETQTYVPKLLAAAKIIGEPQAYGVALHAIPNEPYFETINVKGPVDFAVLKDLDDWDEKTFKRLNGGLRSLFYGNQQNVAIRVPYGHGEKISAHLLAAGPPAVQESFKYLVKSGDTLGELAIRFNVTLDELKRHNGIRRNNIRAGKEILIPHNANTLTIAKNEKDASAHRHIIKPGDTFWTLGRRFGISARALAAHNGHAINKTLFPGQLLTMPSQKSNGHKGNNQETNGRLSRTLSDLAYVVEHGDSLWSIAKRFGVATADLKSWNPLVRGHLLRPGQKLLVQSP